MNIPPSDAEHTIIWKFFLLQVYRTAICDPAYKISNKFQEALRAMTFSSDTNMAKLASIPLNVTYLNTVGGDHEFTKNNVGIADFVNEIIIFDDFLTQTFEDPRVVKYVDFMGLTRKHSSISLTSMKKNSGSSLLIMIPG